PPALRYRALRGTGRAATEECPKYGAVRRGRALRQPGVRDRRRQELSAESAVLRRGGACKFHPTAGAVFFCEADAAGTPTMTRSRTGGSPWRTPAATGFVHRATILPTRNTEAREPDRVSRGNRQHAPSSLQPLLLGPCPGSTLSASVSGDHLMDQVQR